MQEGEYDADKPQGKVCVCLNFPTLMNYSSDSEIQAYFCLFSLPVLTI